MGTDAQPHQCGMGNVRTRSAGSDLYCATGDRPRIGIRRGMSVGEIASSVALPNLKPGARDPDRDTKAPPAIGGFPALTVGEAAPHDPFRRGRGLPLASVRCIRTSREGSERSEREGDSVASCCGSGYERAECHTPLPAIANLRGRPDSGRFDRFGQDWGGSLKADSVQRDFSRGPDSGERVLSFGDAGRTVRGVVPAPLARVAHPRRERCAS